MQRTSRWPKFVLAFGMTATATMLSPALAAETPRSFVTHHVARIHDMPVRYTATVEEFIVNDAKGAPALSLFATSYVRDAKGSSADRPVIFLFNGGPSAAASGVHMQFGPRQVDKTSTGSAEPRFVDNPDSLLDVADLVAFDPAETGYSRVLRQDERSEFYSTDGDSRSLAQLVDQWLARHGRTASPRYLLGESYGSIRQVVTGDMLAKAGTPIDGQIILGDSIFLQETSRRTHNIVSSATSLPLLAMTAAFHGKADKHGKTDAAFLDEVYDYAVAQYLPALAQGNQLSDRERERVAAQLGAYTGIPVSYFLTHHLTVAKQDFNKMLIPGMALNPDDTRIAKPLGPSRNAGNDWMAGQAREYGAYLTGELGVRLPGLDYRIMAPGSFEAWDWGNGCNDYLVASGLCRKESTKSSIFMDYDYPEVLKGEFAYPAFRTMIIAGYYDGLSSIGTHRYLRAQLDYPADRFELHEYPAGHATAGDPAVQPLVLRDVKAFLAKGKPRTAAP